MANFLARCLVLTLFLLSSTHVLAEKTDIVYLKNGDRITGEVKSLLNGKLEFKTDSMSTVYIDWVDIRELVSSTGQAIELSNGQRFYGPLNKPDNEDMLLVNTEQGTVGVGINDVTGMYPVEAGFWDRLDLIANLGFAWDKASSVGKYNISVDATYRNPNFITRGGFSTELTTQEGKDDTSRSNLNGVHIMFRPNRRFLSVFGNLERNEELGIDLRTLAGGGYGWFPIRDQEKTFSLGMGLDVNHEIPVTGDSETNLEAVGLLNFDYYRYNAPQRRLSIDFRVFPSITDAGRLRATYDMTFKFEILRDLFWGVDLFASYDNQPITQEASKTDYGVTSSLGYKF